MPSQASNMSSSRTAFYDLLEVGTNATEQDLKRAYRKRALRLHPDRGGDAEEFKRMKSAYDVLLDPKKRKMYDQYGEAGVKAMEGQVTSEVVMEMFLNVGCWERVLMVCALTIIIGYLLLFPILLCVRWDHPHSLRFAHVFIPVWISLALVLGVCLCLVRAPAIDPEEDDEDMRKQIEELQRNTCILKTGGTAAVSVLFALLFMLVLRLDGDIGWSYLQVMCPWFVVDLILLTTTLWTASYWFAMSGGSPEVLESGKKWATWEWHCHILGLIRPHFFLLAFLYLVTRKMDGHTMNGHTMSWWLVFSPRWVDWAFSIIRNLFRCASVKSRPELEAMSEEARAGEATRGSIGFLFILQAIALGCVVLVCAKLAHARAFPAFIVFIPVFTAGCCLCCCLSCIILIRPPEPEPETAAAPSAAPQARSAPVYGSTADGPASGAPASVPVFRGEAAPV